MFVLSLLLAVTTAVQDSTPRAVRHRPARRTLAASAAALETAAAALAASRVDLQFAVQAPVLAASAVELQQAAIALPALAVLQHVDDVDDVDEILPPEPWAQQDPADSLYRAARQALNRNQYARAAQLFQAVQRRYPRSTYTADSYYWQAFALYRTGSDDALRAARTALRAQATRFPKAATRHDAEVLLRRVQDQLAQRGDREAAEALSAEADSIEPPEPAELPEPIEAPEPPEGPRGHPPRPGTRRSASCDDEDDIRIAALQGLLNMDAERAVPILKAVLAQRDEGHVCLRRKAVWLVSQKRSPETSAILLDAVRADPDREVREQAVFWLSQVPGDETVAALDSILRDPKTDPEIQDKAIFALSQHRSARAGAILRAFAERRDAPSDLREKAIFWLGQNRSADNARFLKDLYQKLENDDLREKVIFSLSQMGGTDNYRWLMDIALDQTEHIEIRKKALFWAGQGHSVDVADLVRLYDSMKDREMREQLIFVYSQRREEAALQKLFDIGKNDPDRELRKKAIFWIGQSRSPRAAQFLQELINQ
jgi:TolA-binding protein